MSTYQKKPASVLLLLLRCGSPLAKHLLRQRLKVRHHSKPNKVHAIASPRHSLQPTRRRCCVPCVGALLLSGAAGIPSPDRQQQRTADSPYKRHALPSTSLCLRRCFRVSILTSYSRCSYRCVKHYAVRVLQQRSSRYSVRDPPVCLPLLPARYPLVHLRFRDPPGFTFLAFRCVAATPCLPGLPLAAT